MFVKGYKQSKETQSKMRAARVKRNGDGRCVVCGAEFEKYHKSQIVCGKVECKTTFDRKRYQETKRDPIVDRAVRLFSTVRLGRGKKDVAIQMVKEAVGTPCVYCGVTLTFENMSLDHKTPRTMSKVYNKKSRKMIYTREEIRVLDSRDNLQLICRDCNQKKLHFTHEEFLVFLDFCKSNPGMAEKILWRFNVGRLFFRSVS